MKKCIITVVSLAAADTPAFAGAGHAGDIEIATDAGRLITGSVAGGSFAPERVFASELGEVVPNLTDEPGFEADAGTLTPGTSLSFRMMDALRVWNGADFDSVSSSTMTLSFLTLSATTSTTPGEVVNGFGFNVNAMGGLHNHPFYQLNAPADTGVYLLELQLMGGGFADSDSLYIVFNQNADEAIHDAAIDYVRDVIVPTPGVSGLLALSGLVALRRRRA